MNVPPDSFDFAGVYFLCKNRRVLYVGKAINIAKRVDTHRHAKDFDTVLVLRLPVEVISAVEIHWIRQLQPKLNRQRHQLKGASLYSLENPHPKTKAVLDRVRVWCDAEYGRRSFLAKELGVSPSLVTDWLAGRRAPDADHVFALADLIAKSRKKA